MLPPQIKTRFNYSISCHSRDFKDYLSVTAAAILAEYARLGRPAPLGLTEIIQHGIYYSYQDFDVLSAAMHDLSKSVPDELTVWERLAAVQEVA